MRIVRATASGLFALAVLMAATDTAAAQAVPHEFIQDTPPVPGQIVRTPREKLRLAPLRLRAGHPEMIGLPTSGPKGLLRESWNAPRYVPRTIR